MSKASEIARQQRAHPALVQSTIGGVDRAALTQLTNERDTANVRHRQAEAAVASHLDTAQAMYIKIAALCERHPSDYECAGLRTYSNLASAVFSRDIMCVRGISDAHIAYLKDIITKATPDEKQTVLAGLLGAIPNLGILCHSTTISPAAVLGSPVLTEKTSCVEYGPGFNTMVFYNATTGKSCSRPVIDDLPCMQDVNILDNSGTFHAVVLIGDGLHC